MHIIFSFISNNRRKEEKNYKYSGKAGDPGSYQFVLNFEDTMNKFYVNYNIEGQSEKYKNLLICKIIIINFICWLLKLNVKKKTEEEYKNLNNYILKKIIYFIIIIQYNNNLNL